jgi:GDP-mannose pyrophosphatase NudK
MTSDVKIIEVEILSGQKYTLKKVVFEKRDSSGEWKTLEREVYDRGNAATILLYNIQKRTVILTAQFRMPTYLNGNPDGMLLEVCAGMLDDDSPEECARREALEETGYRVGNLKKVFSSYMSAGGVTELLHFFTGTYLEKDKVEEGGGLKDEQEDIEVVEMDFDKAFEMIGRGGIMDGKTIMLLQHAQINKIFDSSL